MGRYIRFLRKRKMTLECYFLKRWRIMMEYISPHFERSAEVVFGYLIKQLILGRQNVQQLLYMYIKKITDMGYQIRFNAWIWQQFISFNESIVDCLCLLVLELSQLKSSGNFWARSCDSAYLHLIVGSILSALWICLVQISKCLVIKYLNF